MKQISLKVKVTLATVWLMSYVVWLWATALSYILGLLLRAPDHMIPELRTNMIREARDIDDNLMTRRLQWYIKFFLQIDPDDKDTHINLEHLVSVLGQIPSLIQVHNHQQGGQQTLVINNDRQGGQVYENSRRREFDILFNVLKLPMVIPEDD